MEPKPVQTPMSRDEAIVAVSDIRLGAIHLAAKLAELRDRLGWRALEYSTWAECVKAEFGYSQNYANKLITANKIRARIGTTVPAGPAVSRVIPERHTRELARLPDDQQADAYREAQQEAEGDGEKLTAVRIRATVKRRLPVEPAVVAPDGPTTSEQPQPQPTCPNCGHSGCDHDGDCLQCREPGIGPSTAVVAPVPSREEIEAADTALCQYVRDALDSWYGHYSVFAPCVARFSRLRLLVDGDD